MRRRLDRLIGVLCAAALALGACSNDPEPAPEPSAETTPIAPAPPAPALGACYNLDVAAALELSSSATKVPCSRPHTSVTVAVGRVDPILDGHLVEVESARLQQQIARTCRAKVDAHVGGSVETRRLSRVQAAWFSPTLAQSDAGALWFRCDLVIAGGKDSFARLPARTRNLLSGGKALNRYGTCGTAAPSAAGFRRVACAQKHTWRARASINLPPRAAYLARASGKAADSRCRDIAARRSVALTQLRWSFEWPTKAQWAAGQRYGLCWTPD